VLAGNERALDVLTGIGDWVHTRLEPLRQEQLDRMWDIYIAGEYGGINESLARLHALRPDRPQYLAAARRFDNTAVLRPTAANEDILDGRHANQHIPQFTGYLRMYEEGAGSDYHAAARNFWDMVVPHRVYGHGGMGVGEIFRERGVIAGSLFADENHAETCPLYNLLKLSRALFFHDPDPKYMSYYELGLHNQILGSRRDIDSADSPEVTYFVPVRPGERRSYGNIGTCCGGTGMENHTKYQDSIYFRSADGSTLYVNLYIPSTLRWPERGFTVQQESGYPLEGSSTLTVDGSGALDVRLRVPTWARKGFAVRVNGEEQQVDAVPGTYVTLARSWSPGDTIEVDMPFGVRSERALDDPTVQSLYFGPTLLAVQGEPVGDDLGSGLIEVSLYRHVRLDGDLAPALTPADRPLHFTLHGRTLAPFLVADPQASDPRPYHIYVRRHEPRVVFGPEEAGVDNRARADGVTLLDAVWDQAPFASHDELVAAVERVSEEWQAAGLLVQGERDAVVSAAGRAEAALRV
jgi:hypothetical protein